MVRQIVPGFLLLALALAVAPAPAPAAEARYVVPFLNVMIPPEVADGVFDLFVDALNREGQSRGLEFVILKTPLAEIDSDWLAEQTYVTGELFGYVSDSGCCSTDLSLKGRAEIHLSGEKPTIQVSYAYHTFYDHDSSTPEAERQTLIETMAAALAERVLAALPGS